MVWFPINEILGKTPQGDYQLDEIGELLLHPASERFVYRYWYDLTEPARRQLRERLDNPDPLAPGSRKYLTGAAGFDGSQYWRVFQNPVKGKSRFFRDALVFNSLDDARRYDREEMTNSGSDRMWNAAAPLHLLFEGLGVTKLGNLPLHHALTTSKLRKDDLGDWIISERIPWHFLIDENQTEFGFSRIKGEFRGSGTGPPQHPVPGHFQIEQGTTVKMDVEEFDRLCDYQTYLADDAKITNPSESTGE